MSISRKILFSIVATAVFLLVLEGVLVLAGVRPDRYASDPYVGFSSTSRLFVDDGAGGLETSEAKVPLFNRQRFPADPSVAFRIFCVGGSTTFGRPYDDATSFCGWLREFLYAADPSKNWEVINAGGIITVAAEYFGEASEEDVRADVCRIKDRLKEVFEQARETGRPTHELADELARSIVAAARQ